MVETVGEFCGDGVVNGPEACESAVNSSACTTECRWSHGDGESCGDGVVNGPEDCDLGSDAPAACDYGEERCTLCLDCREQTASGEYCGDGVLNGPEDCDEGPAPKADCAYEMGACALCADCMGKLAVGRYCGDGRVDEPEEECDGTNDCDADCPLLPPPVCGDSLVERGELCDDGNAISKLECPYGTAMCTTCNEDCDALLNLTGPFCGDGSTDGVEECDGQVGCGGDCLLTADRYTVGESWLAAVDFPDFQTYNAVCNEDERCAAVKRCLVNDTSGTDGLSCFSQVPAECACGVGADLTACETELSFDPYGACIDNIVAGLGDDYTRLELTQRLTLEQYSTGRAF